MRPRPPQDRHVEENEEVGDRVDLDDARECVASRRPEMSSIHLTENGGRAESAGTKKKQETAL